MRAHARGLRLDHRPLDQEKENTESEHVIAGETRKEESIRTYGVVRWIMFERR